MLQIVVNQTDREIEEHRLDVQNHIIGQQLVRYICERCNIKSSIKIMDLENGVVCRHCRD